MSWSDKNISKKVKFCETQKEKLVGDHAEPIKTKNFTQPSKKVGVTLRRFIIFQNKKFQLILNARDQMPL